MKSSPTQQTNNKKDILEQDIHNKYFFLRANLIIDFYFFFFFRCLWAVIFGYSYLFWHKEKLFVNKQLLGKNTKAPLQEVLFIGDSTLSFPVQEFAYPYQLLREGYVHKMRIIAHPGYGAKEHKDTLPQILTDNKKYDIIFLSCFQCEIINPSILPQNFEDDSKELFQFLETKLTPEGKIIYIYGDFSQHKIVPNNYFKQYFHYKTQKFISIIKQFESKNFILSELMNTNQENLLWKYFYCDGLHFSKSGQKRLFRDLVQNLQQKSIL